MKRLLVMGLALGLTTGAYAAQDKLSGAEADVQITQQPTATHVTGDQAILTWKTDSTAANNVLYRPVGSSEWKHEFIAKGSKDHWVKLTGLQPNTKYEYQILTTSNKVRAAGQFDTSASGSSASTASTTSSSTAPMTASSANQSGMVANSSVGPHTQNGRVTLYRAVNPTNGAHTFTSSQSEVPSGFTVQGVAGYLVGKDVGSGTAPLYAMTSSTGDYFYTTDAREHANAQTQYGYTDKGIIGYIATTQQTGTVPLYRMLGPNGQHFYTTDQSERTGALGAGWKDEGITGYIWTK